MLSTSDSGSDFGDACSSLETRKRGRGASEGEVSPGGSPGGKRHAGMPPQGAGQVQQLLDVLRQGLGPLGTLSALRKASHSLAELCKQDEFIDEVVAAGAIEVSWKSQEQAGPLWLRNGGTA
jgi:hypothetical protein